MNDYLEKHKYDAHFKGVNISADLLRYKLKKYPVAECEAIIDHGAQVAARITATRVAVGTIILPGIGTIVGALAKKDRNKIYLAITVPDDDVILIELKSTKETKAREFAAKVNKAAAHFAKS